MRRVVTIPLEWLWYGFEWIIDLADRVHFRWKEWRKRRRAAW